jgi:hypothetical protein
MNHT